VTFDAKARVSKSRAAVERASEADSKKKTKSHGLYFIAEPRTMDEGDMPTRDEWLKEQQDKKGKPQPQRSGPEPAFVQGKK